ncbi:MAG: hypothetical protein JXA78_17185 [Anaerolineales bacterium]|nr:hypothetical protein [Anaerolineales bacterium]
MSDISLQMSKEELEALVRRVVREEFSRLIHRSHSLRDDQAHEGPDDPDEDQRLLQDALRLLQESTNRPEAWIGWEEFEAELERAEAAGELPD